MVIFWFFLGKFPTYCFHKYNILKRSFFSQDWFFYSSCNECFMCTEEQQNSPRTLQLLQRYFNRVIKKNYLFIFLLGQTCKFVSNTGDNSVPKCWPESDVAYWILVLITGASFMFAPFCPPPSPHSADSALTSHLLGWDLERHPLKHTWNSNLCLCGLGDENRGRRFTTHAGWRSRQIIKRLWLIKQINCSSLSSREFELSLVAYK